MSEAELLTRTREVLALGFLIGGFLGGLLQRTHFCVMGAISDAVLLQDRTRLRQWVLAVAVAVMGFSLLSALGWVQASQTLNGDRQLLWVSLPFGGLLFGFGMVLASGCGSKTLVRLGTGNLKALVVLLVMGLSAFMTMRGLTAVWRHAALDRWRFELPVAQDLPSLLAHGLGLAPDALVLPLGLGVGGVLMAWVLRRAEGRQAQLWLAGGGVGLLVCATWVLTSRWAYLPEHPLTLESSYLTTFGNRPESLSFVAPSAGLLDYLLFFSDRSKALNLGVTVLLGVVAGAAIGSLLRREFRWEGFRQTEDLANHLLGAALMGAGGVTALGCTFGQGISGLSTLSVGSLMATAGIALGAMVALRYQLWRASRD